jgi:hypothetical protein
MTHFAAEFEAPSVLHRLSHRATTRDRLNTFKRSFFLSMHYYFSRGDGLEATRTLKETYAAVIRNASGFVVPESAVSSAVRRAHASWHKLTRKTFSSTNVRAEMAQFLRQEHDFAAVAVQRDPIVVQMLQQAAVVSHQHRQLGVLRQANSELHEWGLSLDDTITTQTATMVDQKSTVAVLKRTISDLEANVGGHEIGALKSTIAQQGWSTD